MKAVVTIGNGGYEKPEYRDVPMPVPGPVEMPLRVLAAGVYNFKINTRLGLVFAQLTGDTSATAAQQDASETQRQTADGTRPRPFP